MTELGREAAARRGRFTVIAAIVPLLGLAVLLARAELDRRSGTVWAVEITGVDPRDLLRGRYLAYQYRWHWEGPDTCGPGGEEPQREPTPGCCLCLRRRDAGGSADAPAWDPAVQQIVCDAVQVPCDARIDAAAVAGPQRFFVPEERALALEEALRDRAAAITLTVTPARQPAVVELWLDRQPWWRWTGRSQP